jgi:aerobic C4-dicarboxylate transport protein
MTVDAALPDVSPRGSVAAPKKPFYKNLWIQVLAAIALALLLGHFYPAKAIAMKPLGDAFIRLIAMVITLIIFCTVVSGIANVQDIKKVGRLGGKALLYFEVVSTFALFVGLVVGNVVKPGAGFNINPASLDPKAIADFAGQAKAQSVTEFLMHIIPSTVVDAFAKGDILQVLLVSILFGFALSVIGTRAKPILDLLDSLTRTIFQIVNMLMRFAPIGAFGAMAFTVGKYGMSALGPLVKLIAVFYATCIAFVLIVLGAIAAAAGFGIFKFLGFIREEILIVSAVNTSEAALPTLMEKLERLGCSRPLVGLVRSSGDQYASDTDSTTDDFCSRHPYLERRERRLGGLVHRSDRDAYCRAGHSRCEHGIASGNRAFYEHRTRSGKHDWQRRRNNRSGAVGKRTGPRNAKPKSG